MFTLILSDTSGALAANTGATNGGGTITPSNGGKTLTINGTLVQVNADLTTLTDNDPTTPSDTISLTLSDTNGGTATPASIAVTVNGAPAISAPASANVAQNLATKISPITVSETGNTTTSGETFTVVVSDGAGVLAANTGATNGGGTITPSNAGKTLTIAGTLTQVNADLTTLTDDDTSVAADTITISASDSFGNSTATPKSIPVTVTPASSTFNVLVYTDTNGDGSQDDGETGLAGVTVNLLTGSGVATGKTATTNSSGAASFTGLAPGSYEVSVVTPAGDVVSQATNVLTSNALAGGNTANAIEGVYVPATFSVHVYNDANGDGTQDDGESNLAGVTVNLLTGAGKSTGKTATTNSSGNVTFTGLAPGSYEVAVVMPAGDVASQALNINTPITLSSGGAASATEGLNPAPVVTVALVSDTGDSSTDKITSDDALKGTADPNTVVTLKEGGTTLGTAKANASGAWTFTPTTLPQGSNTIVVSDTDADANTGSATFTFTYDSAVPTVTGPTPNMASLGYLEGTNGFDILDLFGGGLASFSAVASFTASGGLPGDTYDFTLGGSGSGPFYLSSSGNTTTLDTGLFGALGAKGGQVYALTLQATDKTSGVVSAAQPFDIVVGGDSSDTINLTSGAKNLGIIPSTPTFIYGLGGDDILNATGMKGPVWLAGGAGGDTMTGGSGINDYIYGSALDSPSWAPDVITNFNVLSDLIDLTGIGQMALSFQSSQLVGDKVLKDSIAWQQSGKNTFVYVNTSGSTEVTGNTDMMIELNGNLKLTAANFVHH
ncbi:MAG: SdrD B-like domain-containing protein [Acetobacteraceae bacterium]